jgi:hypothetical protein
MSAVAPAGSCAGHDRATQRPSFSASTWPGGWWRRPSRPPPPSWRSATSTPAPSACRSPTTYSTLFQDDGRLVQAALEGLAEEPVAVVATLPAGDPARVRAPARREGGLLTRNRKNQRPMTGRQHGWRINKAYRWRGWADPAVGMPLSPEEELEGVRDGRDFRKRRRDLDRDG